eukprot:TRINITY_DN34175_c0_g1_i1.p1 TRINITY_DN34175_c0_g1~~TRINITY_DN34175_c0_g1_i1.p1  ORF type:complete len:147 (+),score=26.25 TRINITY_DN34175_c0_g1_i1:50-442(+)
MATGVTSGSATTWTANPNDRSSASVASPAASVSGTADHDQRTYSEQDMQRAFLEISLQGSLDYEMKPADLVRFYGAIGEELTDEEASRLIKAVSSDSTVKFADFRRLAIPPADWSHGSGVSNPSPQLPAQ